MAYRSGDAGIFLRDGETAVTAGGATFQVNLEFPESVSDFGGQSMPGVVTGKPTIQYKTSVGLKGGDIVTIDQVKYTIAAPRKIGDGLFSVADLHKVKV